MSCKGVVDPRKEGVVGKGYDTSFSMSKVPSWALWMG